MAVCVLHLASRINSCSGVIVPSQQGLHTTVCCVSKMTLSLVHMNWAQFFFLNLLWNILMKTDFCLLVRTNGQKGQFSKLLHVYFILFLLNWEHFVNGFSFCVFSLIFYSFLYTMQNVFTHKTFHCNWRATSITRGVSHDWGRTLFALFPLASLRLVSLTHCHVTHTDVLLRSDVWRGHSWARLSKSTKAPCDRGLKKVRVAATLALYQMHLAARESSMLHFAAVQHAGQHCRTTR